MGTFGSAFRQSTTLAATASTAPVDGAALATARSNTDALQADLNALHAAGGGFLRVPPGRFLLGRRGGTRPTDAEASVEGGDLLVYDDIVVWFAPGAVFVPLGSSHAGARNPGGRDTDEDASGVRIEWQGGIRAARRTIFDPWVSAGAPAGRVLFTGERVRVLYPEWWGAGTGFPGSVNRAGLQAALDAAHRDRYRVERDVDGNPRHDLWGREIRRHRPAIPVVLTGTYAIDRALVVGSPEEDDGHPRNRAGFVLRGEHGVGATGMGRPSLVSADPRVDDLLEIHRVSSFHVEGVTFDAGFGPRAVRVMSPGGDGAESVFEGCAFVNATTALVEIAGTRLDVDAGQAPCLLSLRRCRLETMAAGRSLDVGTSHVGVRLDASASVLVELRNCFLTGPANPFVQAKSGWLSLRECTSHVYRHLDTRSVEVINKDLSTPNGTDLYIDVPSAETAAGLLEPASLTAREYECQSWQCVGSFAGGAVVGGCARTSNLLINLNHANVPAIDAGTYGLEDQPAIYWDGPARHGADLLVMGALLTPRFDAIRETAAGVVPALRWSAGRHGGYIHVVGGINGRVYDLGIASRGLPEPMEVLRAGLGVGSTVLFGSDPFVASVQVQRVPLRGGGG